MKINRDNYEEIFFDYTEGNLTASEREEVRQFLGQNPDLQSELEAFEKAYLIPDETIVFEGKQQLKQQAGGHIRWLYYTVGSVAAAVILFLVLFNQNPNVGPVQEKPQLVENKSEADEQEDSAQKEKQGEGKEKTETEAAVPEKINNAENKETPTTKAPEKEPVAMKEATKQPDADHRNREQKKPGKTAMPVKSDNEKKTPGVELKEIESIKPGALAVKDAAKKEIVEMPVTPNIQQASYVENSRKNGSKSEIKNLWDVAEKVVAYADEKVKPTLELQQERANNDNEAIALNIQIGKFGFSKKFKKGN